MKHAQAESNDAVLASADVVGNHRVAPRPSKLAIPWPAIRSVLSPPNATRETELSATHDLDDAVEDVTNINLEPGGNDTADTCIAKRMMDRMIADLVGEKLQSQPDLFGHVDGDRETRKLDALIWMYDLNPDGSDIPFVWVCDELGLDHERLKRITARSVREDLKRILKVLTGMVGIDYARSCELKLSDYVNLTGWNLH